MSSNMRPDHEPGPGCPNAPHTCLVCQPKLERKQRAEVNRQAVRDLLSEHQPGFCEVLRSVERILEAGLEVYRG